MSSLEASDHMHATCPTHVIRNLIILTLSSKEFKLWNCSLWHPVTSFSLDPSRTQSWANSSHFTSSQLVCSLMLSPHLLPCVLCGHFPKGFSPKLCVSSSSASVEPTERKSMPRTGFETVILVFGWFRTVPGVKLKTPFAACQWGGNEYEM
jgi:hypothetical protein